MSEAMTDEELDQACRDAADLANEIHAFLAERQPRGVTASIACALVIRSVYMMEFQNKGEVSEEQYYTYLARLVSSEFSTEHMQFH